MYKDLCAVCARFGPGLRASKFELWSKVPGGAQAGALSQCGVCLNTQRGDGLQPPLLGPPSQARCARYCLASMCACNKFRPTCYLSWCGVQGLAHAGGRTEYSDQCEHMCDKDPDTCPAPGRRGWFEWHRQLGRAASAQLAVNWGTNFVTAVVAHVFFRRCALLAWICLKTPWGVGSDGGDRDIHGKTCGCGRAVSAGCSASRARGASTMSWPGLRAPDGAARAGKPAPTQRTFLLVFPLSPGGAGRWVPPPTAGAPVPVCGRAHVAKAARAQRRAREHTLDTHVYTYPRMIGCSPLLSR